MGSVLSDYTKPMVIRRNKDGMSSSESEDHEDGRVVPVIRVSGDGGSNEDGEIVKTSACKMAKNGAQPTLYSCLKLSIFWLALH